MGQISLLELGPLLVLLLLLFVSSFFIFLPKGSRVSTYLTLITASLIFLFMLLKGEFSKFEVDFGLNKFGMTLTIVSTLIFIICIYINGFKSTRSISNSVISGFILVASVFLMRSNEMVTLYISTEMISVLGYLLLFPSIADSKKITTLSYFIQNVLGHILLLLAISFFYGATGQFDLQEFTVFNHELYSISVGFFILYIFYRLGVFPYTWGYQVWPSIDHGAMITLFYTNTVVVGLSFLSLAQSLIVETDLKVQEVFIYLVITLVVINSLYANFLSLTERNYSKLMSYAYSFHIGVPLLSIVLFSTGLEEILLFNLMALVLSSIGSNLIITEHTKHSKKLDFSENLNGLFFRDPLLGGLLILFILSFIGLPLTAGFSARFMLLSVYLKEGLLVSTMLILISSAIGFWPLLQIIRNLFYQTEIHSPNGELMTITPRAIKIVAILMGIMVVLGGVLPKIFLK